MTIIYSVEMLKSLYSFQATYNYLTGLLPLFPNSSRFFFIGAFNNHFSGKLGSISHLTNLGQILINNNHISGPFFHQFNSSDQVSIELVNIANNLFSGPISGEFFNLPRVSALSLVSNCFTGTLTETICAATSLTTIDFDGVGNNAACSRNEEVNRLRPPFISGIFTDSQFHGTIPSCLMTMPLLQVLHLSANNLHGSIPNIYSNESILNDLTLSNNGLTGTIPASIQNHIFIQLDLSNNRLDGVLINGFQVSNDQTTLSLAVNRLSGPLPSSFLGLSSLTYPNMSTLNVLASNIFDCSNNDIPPLDEYSRSYSCGSYELNVTTYVWISVLGLVLILVFIAVVLGHQHETLNKVKDACRGWSILTRIDIDEIRENFRKYRNYSNFALHERLQDLVRLLSPHDIGDTSRYSNSSGHKPSNDDFIMSPDNFDRCSKLDSQQSKVADSIEMNMFSSSIVNSVSTTPSSKLLSLCMDIKGYLLMLRIIQRFAFIVGSIVIFVLMPSFIGLSRTNSIVSFEYGYIISMTFLHGEAPVLLLGLIVFLLLAGSIVSISLLQQRLSSIIQSSSNPSNDVHQIWSFKIRKYSLLIALHLTNIVVTVAVNGAYVNTILSHNNITRTNLLVIQGLIGMFKLCWNGVYIPWCSQLLSKYMSQSRSMQNRLIMAITNFIVAPLVATAVVNQSCFYYAFKQTPPTQSSVVLNTCVIYVACNDGIGLCCDGHVEMSFASTYNPSFQYSYACGSALLETYLPVLLYTYIFYGFLQLSMQMLMILFYKDIRRIYRSHMVVVKGREKISSLLLHVTMLLTFGLSSTILGVAIVIAVVSDCFISQLNVGLYIHESRIDRLQTQGAAGSSQVVCNPISHQQEQNQTAHDADPERDLERFSHFDEPIYVNNYSNDQPSVQLGQMLNGCDEKLSQLKRDNIDKSEMDSRKILVHDKPDDSLSVDSPRPVSYAKDSQIKDFADEIPETRADPIHQLVERDAWCGIFACSPIIVATVSVFWALLFFDAVADVRSVEAGIVTSLSMGAGLPFLRLILSNIIPRLYGVCRTSIPFKHP